MKKGLVFRGSATAIVTPFRNGLIDYNALDKMISYQLEHQTDAIVVCGTTGEFSTLTTEERKDCIWFVVNAVAGKCPVIAGTGCNDTAYSVMLSKFAEECGADALLLVTPYYNKTTQEGLVAHYKTIANAVSLPCILYNVPSRTGLSISLPSYLALSKEERVVATKEASGDLSSITKLAAACGKDLTIYSGNDDQILPVLSIGGMGVISVISNILPQEVHNLCENYFAGNIAESARLQLELLPFIETLFSEVNPIPIKAALAMCGFCSEEVRQPLCSASRETKARLRAHLERWNLL